MHQMLIEIMPAKPQLKSVADFSYPKVYVNLLSILQQFVVGEAYAGDRSINCITFLKKYSERM